MLTRHARIAVVAFTAIAIVLCVLLAPVRGAAHEGSRKKAKQTKATRDLRLARRMLDKAKARLEKAGKYSCCTKPTCDMCVRTHGSCNCAETVAAGKGSCGECHANWQAGYGDMKGVKASDVAVRTSCHDEGTAPPPNQEAALARQALDRAKRTLVAEGNYSCCMKGGCDVCTHEGECRCGEDLAADLADKDKGGDAATKQPRGVCGECNGAWKNGQGAFAGVAEDEVWLADMASLAMLTPAGGPYRSHSALASGTAQVPAASPMYGYHFTAGDWFLTLHGDLKVGFNRQYGNLGAGKLESQNWLMSMAEREMGPGTLMLRGMVSGEPLTAPHGGFRQLFQTGESYRGKPLYDAQHPHDLFMELAALYTVPIGERSSVQLYLAPVGEPALGPPAFMHRPSAADNPSAPLGHHGEDSAHISHGVITLGVQAGKFKFETTAFHGKEPDEKRAGIEFGAIDSFSGRVWYTPNRNWTMQVSAGRMNDAEISHPGDLVRVTASVHHNFAWDDNNVATSLIWGRDHEIFGNYNNYLLESTLRLHDTYSLYTRAELVDKSDLIPQQYVPAVISFKRAPDPPAPGVLRHPGQLPDGGPIPSGYIPVPTQTNFRVGAFTFGGVREIYDDGRIAVGIGADVTVHTRPGVLDARYGEHPIGSHIFIRVRPSGDR